MYFRLSPIREVQDDAKGLPCYVAWYVLNSVLAAATGLFYPGNTSTVGYGATHDLFSLVAVTLAPLRPLSRFDRDQEPGRLSHGGLLRRSYTSNQASQLSRLTTERMKRSSFPPETAQKLRSYSSTAAADVFAMLLPRQPHASQVRGQAPRPFCPALPVSATRGGNACSQRYSCPELKRFTERCCVLLVVGCLLMVLHNCGDEHGSARCETTLSPLYSSMCATYTPDPQPVSSRNLLPRVAACCRNLVQIKSPPSERGCVLILLLLLVDAYHRCCSVVFGCSTSRFSIFCPWLRIMLYRYVLDSI